MASSKEASTWDYELTARPAAAQNRGARRRGPGARRGKSGVVRVLVLTVMFFMGALLWEDGTMTDLGTLGGPDSYAYGLNNRGDVVGWTTGASGRPRAFLWSNGSMSDIGTLGGDAAEAWDINDAGQIVGDSEAFGLSHAFLWQDGTMTDLGTLGGIRGFSGAYGINEAGQVVGYSYTQTYGMEHACLWQDGVMTDLGAREGYTSRAFAISDVGQIVGTSNE